MSYAELHCLSNFSFQRGASSALELFERAKRQGYSALAITDECTLSGIVRAWQAAKAVDLPLIIGSEMHIENGPKLVLLVESLSGYQHLCRLITLARRRAEKGRYRLLQEDFEQPLPGLLALWVAQDSDTQASLDWLRRTFDQRLWLAVHLHCGQDDARHLQQRLQLAHSLQIPAVACGDVHMHARGRRALQDTMTAIRHHVPVAEAGTRLHPNGERHLRSLDALAALYPQALLDETLVIARRCTFDLGQLRYHYPRELVPAGHDAQSWLRTLTEEGIAQRWPEGIDDKTVQQIRRELQLISELGYESYFLTVHDIVRFARSRSILCQGRGSAANSAVCFALGITEINPSLTNLLFERFLSKERNEPPDIDVDFEHERREEVLQYVFQRYGRTRAALTAVVSSYHATGAVRDVAKALGLPADQINALADCCGRWSDEAPPLERLRESGFDPDSPLLRRVLTLTQQLIGFPRHLSQHPGGFVISEYPLDTLVPVENAAMAERTIIQWDKDDLDAVGLLKVDILALGMLSAIRRCFDLLRRHRHRDLSLATIPKEDPATYAMISKADTIGVFQIESRAQMSMLPRLKPQTFYDLVIEVAIVRPGPIQGGMVHPYLQRRQRKEAVEYPKGLEKALGRTLGIPIFQEQVMQVAVIAANFTPGEADQLRRAMAAWKRKGGMNNYQERIVSAMVKNGYDKEFADAIFSQIEGFGEYGFPESHAASFALLTYASSWLKCHEPAAFLCALLNSQPMGFYSPSQLVQDARRHGVPVLPVDVAVSGWEAALEGEGRAPAVRLGLNSLFGMRAQAAARIEDARAIAAFVDVADLARRGGLDRHDLQVLAAGNALHALAGHRRAALWQAAGAVPDRDLLRDTTPEEDLPMLAAPTEGESIVSDYRAQGLTLGRHPLALLRKSLLEQRFLPASTLMTYTSGQVARACGIVTVRQRPGTAKGVLFMTLEDETGTVNVIVWPDLVESQRREVLSAPLLGVYGVWQREGMVCNLVAKRLVDMSHLLGRLRTSSRDFC